MKRRILLAIAVLVATASVLAAVAQADSRGDYIVVLKPGTGDPGGVAKRQAERFDARSQRIFHRVLPAYAASIPSAKVTSLRRDPSVAYVEPNRRVHLTAYTESPAPWGLDRIDQHARPLDGSFHYWATGAGVTAYIVDTGIRQTHSDFGGRAVAGYDAVTQGGGANDCNGHGTHVAGTTGGSRYGVAKDVRLVAVRVLDCTGSGTLSDVLAGLDWIDGNHTAGTPAVANLSFGGAPSRAFDQAVQRTIDDGVSVVVAAGNDGANACSTSPGRVPGALTVGATNRSDQKPSWSDYGGCIDWFAPGVNITSDWNASDSATATLTGTSMAAPHTTGAVAQYLQEHPAATPAAVRRALFGVSTKHVVANSGSTNNNLLYSRR